MSEDEKYFALCRDLIKAVDELDIDTIKERIVELPNKDALDFNVGTLLFHFHARHGKYDDLTKSEQKIKTKKLDDILEFLWSAGCRSYDNLYHLKVDNVIDHVSTLGKLLYDKSILQREQLNNHVKIEDKYYSISKEKQEGGELPECKTYLAFDCKIFYLEEFIPSWEKAE